MDQLIKQQNSSIGENSGGKPRILVAPLDWGLGHATRCIPIITELLAQGFEVLLGVEGAQEELLKMEFPELKMLPLPGYRIRYAKTRTGLLKTIIFQIPGILKSIKKEHAWLKAIVEKEGIDAVISDNRYGLYHTSIPSIFMTHQLLIKTTFGKRSERLLQKRNYRYINRFTECWVPDSETNNGLAGDLSHPVKKPAIPLRYIGNLSRFDSTGIAEIKDHLLILLSGPEPQRTLLENKIIEEIVHYQGTATVIRGLPGSASIIPSTNMIKFYNHLPASSLNTEIEEAEFVIARSGYSSVMDLVKMKKKSILIPTPGQTEQEYLGGYLSEQNIACTISQKDFTRERALQVARNFRYELPVVEKNILRELIAGLFPTKPTKNTH